MKMLISSPNKQAGFTLVELMVVLFLIGLIASAVILTVINTERGSTSQVERFAARIAALRDRAVVEANPLAFWVRASGYGFERWTKGRWQPLEAPPFDTVNWQQPIKANVPSGRMVRIAFDANGIPSVPMDIMLSSGTKPLRVKMDAAGNIDVAR